MSNVTFDSKQYTLETDESVLDCLLRNGIEIPHGCKAGACQSCVMQSTSVIPPTAQKGLKQSQKELGYFLSCSCKPTEDIEVAFNKNALDLHQARILEISKLAENVVKIRLQAPFNFRAGQYINLWLDETTTRSYSIASPSSEPFIDLHVKVFENGRFSSRAEKTLKPGDTLNIQGPIGECIYTNDKPDAPLILAGIGTGLAPLFGILHDAINFEHSGKITLYVGASQAENLYLCQELTSLSKENKNLEVFFSAQQGSNPHLGEEQLKKESIYELVKRLHPSTQGCRVYLCGAPSFVNKMRKQSFLAGASMQDIHCDAFLPSAD